MANKPTNPPPTSASKAGDPSKTPHDLRMGVSGNGWNAHHLTNTVGLIQEVPPCDYNEPVERVEN